jgi:hypothetical protein
MGRAERGRWTAMGPGQGGEIKIAKILRGVTSVKLYFRICLYGKSGRGEPESSLAGGRRGN